ncbi:carbohydrate porin [Pectobacterium polaris]|uniref:carbohydrate porin n=2 Tax=Pectobacterium polaris TaxID=2042057 RepID=UPI0015815C2F|nr:carbohydrate porin [Pectobacterium polaris]MBN3218319.1 carbohydrate porin [Pectobacterium polaris]
MHHNKIAIYLASCFISISSVHAANLSDDGSFQLNGYGMVAGDFQSEFNRPKNMSLHADPTGPNQDPRGKMGDLGNSFWHDYFTSLAITKKWQGVGAPEQWADYTYQMVGYGDKSIETAQNFGRFGGLSFLPEDANIWAGRRYLDERLSIFAYNTKEIHVDSGVGYSGKDLDVTIGTAQIDWSSASAPQAIEGSRRIFDIAYRVGPTEWGATYVKELDNPLNTGVQRAMSFSGKYNLSSFMGIAEGRSSLKFQYGKGIIAQYLNTSRISVLSEEGDSALRLTLDGSLNMFDDFAVTPAFIYEYTKRDKSAERTTLIPDTSYAGGNTIYGSGNETGIFAGVSVKQNLHHQNLSMLYEAVINNTTNKNGVIGADGTAYKIAMGPAIQLDVMPYAAPIASLTLTYAGGDRAVTLLPTDSEWRLGYRLEVWF